MLSLLGFIFFNFTQFHTFTSMQNKQVAPAAAALISGRFRESEVKVNESSVRAEAQSEIWVSANCKRPARFVQRVAIITVSSKDDRNDLQANKTAVLRHF